MLKNFELRFFTSSMSSTPISETASVTYTPSHTTMDEPRRLSADEMEVIYRAIPGLREAQSRQHLTEVDATLQNIASSMKNIETMMREQSEVQHTIVSPETALRNEMEKSFKDVERKLNDMDKMFKDMQKEMQTKYVSSA